VATLSDPNWPSAASLVCDTPVQNRRNAGLVGVHTYSTSLSPRSATSTPDAIRAALAHYSTWSYGDSADLANDVALVDYGNVDDPDGNGGHQRVADALDSFDAGLELSVVLGGDNAATWHAMRAVTRGDYSNFGLITLDAHLDFRDGASNGSPVRQLIDDGLDGRQVVQIGLADFSNSPAYAKRVHEAGIHAISRDALRKFSVEEAAVRAVQLAGAGGRRVYLDVDMDAADRAVVPGCSAAAPGGLSADEMRRFVRAAVTNPAVCAIDITEIDVELDSPDQRTVRLGALLVLEALAGLRRRVR
jgi:formiminoglutamase